ncbi:MAG: protein kinase [Acidobacteriota bacterium]|jgi:serine/threonine-protein kinase|nr:protein kinase [Acidobacteriota bacterium]
MIFPGLEIGEYIIDDELGRGGFGSVFLARNQENNQWVAIKFLHPKVIRSEKARQAFIDEMINQARLSISPNIVHVLRSINYSDHSGEHLGMVMEFVDGDPLDMWIQRYNLLPEFAAVPLFIQVLRGLQVAHENGMLHRDIKPGNIIIGYDGLVKIMDFGLSKMISGAAAASESARAASLNYVAPERLERQRIDARADIYSVGATMYEALTGHPPYQLDYGDWEQARNSHKSGSFKSIRHYCEAHSEELERIVSRSLAPDPANRFADCRNMEEELGRLWGRLALPAGADESFCRMFQTTIELVEGRFASRSVQMPSYKKDRPQAQAPAPGFDLEKQRRDEEAERIRQEEEKRHREEEEKRRREEDLKREAEMAEQRRLEAERRKQEAMASVNHLIETGRFEEAEQVLREHFELGEEFAAHRIALLSDWGKNSKEYETAYSRQDYRKATEKIDELIDSVPEGEGKEKLVKKRRETELEQLETIQSLELKLKTAESGTEKAAILKRLIHVGSKEQLDDWRAELNSLQQEISEKRRKTTILSLSAAIVLVLLAVFLFAILPGIRFRSSVKEVQATLQTSPAKALKMIESLQRKHGSAELDKMRSQALFQVRTKRAMEMLEQSRSLEQKNDFDGALKVFSSIKQDVFPGAGLPEEVRKAEMDLRISARDYYVELARTEKDPGNKYLHYCRALDFRADSAVQREADEYANRHSRDILASLVRQGNGEGDCKRARYIVSKGMQLSAAHPGMLKLREQVYRRCR